MIHYLNCPICGSANIQPALEARDYTVSKELFGIWHCGDCMLRFTQDVPSPDAIGAYYQSAGYISHTDTKEGLVNSLYHWVRSYTLRSKRRLVKRLTGLSSGTALDLGCGTGAFLHTLQQAGWTVTGLEPDPGAREVAKRLYRLTVLPIEELFSPGLFDLITMWHVLEHVHDLHGYIDRLRELLKPGGTILIAVPNYTSFDAAHYGPYWAAYDVPRHLYHFSPFAMERLLGLHGLRLDEVRPMWFDSFYVSMLSERYRTGRGRLASAVWNGLRSNLRTVGSTERCSSLIYVVHRTKGSLIETDFEQ